MMTSSPNPFLRHVLRRRPSEVRHDVLCLPLSIVNVVLLGHRGAGDRQWVLVDAGLRTSASAIRRAAAERFGIGSRPAAIVLTHGHFDHVGALPSLAKLWDAPIYAHELEFPYLTGESRYAPPDPTVGGGAMARLAKLYPRGPIDVSDRLLALPEDGRVPHLDEWRWIATPGHTPGHVSLFRDRDSVLIAGDAFVTTKQESLLSVLTQAPCVWRPPAYYTSDWQQARSSVEELYFLQPRAAIAGHGVPLEGRELLLGLQQLVESFDELIPVEGRYGLQPVIAGQHGPVAVPPSRSSALPALAALALSALAVAFIVQRRSSESGEPTKDFVPADPRF